MSALSGGAAVLILCLFSLLHSTCGQVPPQNSVRCPGKINLAVAMDASQSLGKFNFLLVKNYTKMLASNLSADANFLTIAFADEVDEVVGTPTDLQSTLAQIDAFNKDLIPKTNTDYAIGNLTEILITKGDPSKPKVGVIVTDGRSTNGINNVKQKSNYASLKEIIMVAVGVGTDYAIEELYHIAGGKPEHVINGTFLELQNAVLSETLEVICKLSITDPATTTDRPNCTTDGIVAIGVEVSDKYSELGNSGLIPLLEMLSFGTQVILKDSQGYPETTLGSLVDTLVQFQNTSNLPRVAVIILDESALRDFTHISLTKRVVDFASEKNIHVVALIIGQYNDSMQELLTTVFGSVNKLFTVDNLDAITTSGFNQIINRICKIMSLQVPVTAPTSPPVATTTSPLSIYGGPVELHITFDVCEENPQNLPKLKIFGDFNRYLAEKLHLGYSNVSLTSSFTFCSGSQIIAASDNNVFQVREHSSIQMAYYQMAYDVDAVSILNSSIHTLDSSVANFTIIFITDNKVEPDLQSIVDIAKAEGIQLMAIILTEDGNPSQAMQEKAAIIDSSYITITYDQVLSYLNEAISIRLTQYYNTPAQALVGITLGGRPIEYENIVKFTEFLKNMKINANMQTDVSLTQYLKGETIQYEMASKPNIVNTIKYVTRRHSSSADDKFDYVIIMTNQEPHDAAAVKQEIDAAMLAGVKVLMTGWTDLPTSTNQVRAIDGGTLVDIIKNGIQNGGKTLAIMIDSSEGISDQEFSAFISLASSILSNLRMQYFLEIHTFDRSIHQEIARTSMQQPSVNGIPTVLISVLRSLYRITHLMHRPPFDKAVQLLYRDMAFAVSQTRKTIGVLLMDRPMRYPSLTSLQATIACSSQLYNITLVVVDTSAGGNITDIESLFDRCGSTTNIIRLKDQVDFQSVARSILDIMSVSGYNDFRVFFALGQLRYLQENFPEFDRFLQNFEQGINNNDFNADYNVITMERNAIFDHLHVTMNQVTLVLEQFMRLSDDGSELAVDFLVDEVKAKSYTKQPVNVIMTAEEPKFPQRIAQITSEAKGNGIYTLAMGLGANLTEFALDSLTNVENNGVFVARSTADLNEDGTRWLISQLNSLDSLLTTPPPASTPPPLSCNGSAEIGFGVTSSLEARDAFFRLQQDITEPAREFIKFKFISFYVFYNETSDHTPPDPEAFENVLEELNERLMKMYSGVANQIAIIFTDGASAAGGISPDTFNKISPFIDFIVFGVGQFSPAVTADLLRLTGNRADHLILVATEGDLYNSKKINDLGQLLCDAVEKPPINNIRTNITEICDALPVDPRFTYQTENVKYPFDCTKFINCRRSNGILESNVVSCPDNIKFNAASQKCDTNAAIPCETVTAEEFDLETGAIIDVPKPHKVANLTEECEKHCFKATNLFDNYDYTYHPDACSKFIVCYRTGSKSTGYTYSARVEECPIGKFWDQDNRMCLSIINATCKSDPCKGKVWPTFRNVNCRYFYECRGAMSRLRICGRYTKAQNGDCVQDAVELCDISIDVITEEEMKCDFLPWINKTKYVDTTSAMSVGGETVESCPAGTLYNHQTCSCSDQDKNFVHGACQPVSENTMDQQGILNNVRFASSAASFNGRGSLALQPLSSTLKIEFLVYIKLMLTKYKQNTNVLRSCKTGSSSIRLDLVSNVLTAVVSLPSGDVSLSTRVQFYVEQDIFLAYDGTNVILHNSGTTVKMAGSGELNGCQGDFRLGFQDQWLDINDGNDMTPGFYGDVDEVHVYNCIPDKYKFLFN